jgi:hypothetical protein
MSDHIDGPRTTADPSIDVTDLYFFTSPSDPSKSVMIGNVFPFAGESALFSDAVLHSFVIRRVNITGVGNSAGFKPFGPEIRFTFRFSPLKKTEATSRPSQSGSCTLPNGQVLNLESGNELGTFSTDKSIRVFAGVRSDPFFIGWLPSIPVEKNMLDGDNVLSLVVEFDTKALLDLSEGSLFGAIFETTPVDVTPQSVLVRYDWVGRPEHTNFRIFGAGKVDLRDMWNQLPPFDLDPSLLPLFRQRLEESFKIWDLKDNKIDWDPAALNANINVFLDDFLVFDVSKKISDSTHLEIEKSTIEGLPYTTGGGRTLDANVCDICITWLVNRDRGPFLQSPAYQATKPGGTTFPYVQPPNTKIFTVTRSVDLAASAKDVWALIGTFNNPWHPLIVEMKSEGKGVGELRTYQTVDGKVITERLAILDNTRMLMKYTLVGGIPADVYDGVIEVTPKGGGCVLTWTVNFHPAGIGKFFLNLIVTTLIDSGVNDLKNRFGKVG